MTEFAGLRSVGGRSRKQSSTNKYALSTFLSGSMRGLRIKAKNLLSTKYGGCNQKMAEDNLLSSYTI
jgi:hypothetical protein